MSLSNELVKDKEALKRQLHHCSTRNRELEKAQDIVDQMELEREGWNGVMETLQDIMDKFGVENVEDLKTALEQYDGERRDGLIEKYGDGADDLYDVDSVGHLVKALHHENMVMDDMMQCGIDNINDWKKGMIKRQNMASVLTRVEG